MSLQKTKFQSFLNNTIGSLSKSFIGPWKLRSLGLLSLLIGFYLGSNLTVYYLQKTGQRPLVVFFMVIIIELLIRLRSNVKNTTWPLLWLAIDNVRIGSIYSIVLEAFKLGS